VELEPENRLGGADPIEELLLRGCSSIVLGADEKMSSKTSASRSITCTILVCGISAATASASRMARTQA
jgi:hypothetical protein